MFGLWRNGKLNISLCMLMLVFAVLEPQASELLRYDRGAIVAGEWWRLISGHFVHLVWEHALLNLAGLVLITFIFWPELSFKFDALALIGCIIGTSIGLYGFSEELLWYVGFSGVLHGYLIYFLIKGYLVLPMPSLLAISSILIKVLWEQSPWGHTRYTEALIGGAVAIDAHLYGMISGVIVGMMLLWVGKGQRVGRG